MVIKTAVAVTTHLGHEAIEVVDNCPGKSSQWRFVWAGTTVLRPQFRRQRADIVEQRVERGIAEPAEPQHRLDKRLLQIIEFKIAESCR